MLNLLTSAAGLLAGAKATTELFLIDDAPKKEDWIKDIDLNKEPVIGILSQTLEKYMHKDARFSNYTSYMMSDYVRYMEAQGARVIPIINGEPKNVTLDKLAHVDGVLFPGGDGDDFDLGKLVFDEIVKYNNEGHFYPAWGTCLGYENMVAYTADAGLKSWGSYVMHNTSIPVKFLMKP